jgi:TRAP-type mannitol/chloroaromatic compound transport system permease small subunit
MFVIDFFWYAHENKMNALLKFSKAVDWLNGQIGKYVIWLILASTVISARQRHGPQGIQRGLQRVSRSAVVPVCRLLPDRAAYTLLNGEHVKIDVISSKLSKRAQIWIDVLGFASFSPQCAWPFCGTAFRFS